MAQNILIIGNGFDLYHHLPTRYSDFMFFASEWRGFELSYEKYLAKTGSTQQINVPLTDRGELTQEALTCFGQHPYLLDETHIEFLRQNLQKNTWIRYFDSLLKKGLRWVDFEAEIQNALYDTKEYSMKIIPAHVGRVATDGIPERLSKIADIFGEAANTDYLNFGAVEVLEHYADHRELQANKERLIEFMLNELNILINLSFKQVCTINRLDWSLTVEIP